MSPRDDAPIALARPRPAVARALAAALLAVAIALLTAPTARAHTELDTTDPADGATVDRPVDRLVLTFTLPVTPLGDAVTLAGPDGDVPVEVTQEQDGAVVIATPAEPLTDGDYAVTWTAAAEDGHPLDGTYAFAVAVAGAAPEPTASPTPTASRSGAVTPSAAAEPSATPSPAATHADPEAAGGDSDDLAARIVARTGSAIALWALLVGGGALVFAATALRGRDAPDAARIVAGVRWCGALLLGGLALRLVGRSALLAGGAFADAVTPDALGDALAGTAAWVFGLQAAGGLLMLLGARRTPARSWLAWLGVALAGAGHVLGGHSNTAEPRGLVLTADIAHLAAAAVWAGGVLGLVAVLRRRARDGRAADAGAMASRYGVIASAAFVVVGLAGIALTWAIVDRPSDLWTTTWGFTLLVKVALVAAIAGIGAYTHFRVVPRLARDDAAAAEEAGHLRRAVGWESVLFAAVVIATAILVAASVHA